jgi:hypothetical protein
MTARAPREAAPVGTTALRTRLEDWILAGVFALFPLLGLTLGRGDAFALASVGILLWIGHRAPISPATRDGHGAAGIAVLLVMLCLLLPQLEAASARMALPAFELTRVIRLGLAAVLLIALLRGGLPRRAWMRAADLAILAALLGAVGFMSLLWWSGEETASRILAEVTVSLGLVFGIHRFHLLRSEALPVLVRAALAGVAGALVVMVLR